MAGTRRMTRDRAPVDRARWAGVIAGLLPQLVLLTLLGLTQRGDLGPVAFRRSTRSWRSARGC